MKVKISELKHHPLNERIYKLTGIEELIESIQSVGLLQPITIDQHNQVISGNRRYEACRRIGWDKIEANKMFVKEGDETLLLVHFNQQRVKTAFEILNEHNELRGYYKKNGNLGGRKVRNLIAEDLKVSDGQLARLLFIQKHRLDFIKLIDDGILTVNQAYLKVSRDVGELTSINSNGDDFEKRLTVKPEKVRFYLKSSHDMPEIEDGEIQTIFTSPPYPNSVRRYSNDDGLGNEKTIEEYIENLSSHLDDCYRVLKTTGSFFLNIGDVFIDGHLQSVPHRVLLGLLNRKKWILRNTLIWSKTNPKPSSTKTNHTPSYEFIFHLVKSKNYDFKRLLMPLSTSTKPSHPPRHRNGKGVHSHTLSPYIPNPLGKNIPDFWTEDVIRTSVSNQKMNNGIEHPAMFPISVFTIPLIQTSILPFLTYEDDNSHVNSSILDPFAGSLSVYKGIEELNKIYKCNLQFVGYDIKKFF